MYVVHCTHAGRLPLIDFIVGETQYFHFDLVPQDLAERHIRYPMFSSYHATCQGGRPT